MVRVDIIKVNYQPDCIFVDVTDKVESKIEVLPMEPVFPGIDRAMCIIEAPDEEELSKTIRFIDMYPYSREVRIISKEKKIAEIRLMTNTTKLYNRIRSYGGFVLGVMNVKDGKEEWAVSFNDLQSKRELIETLKDDHDIKIKNTIEVPCDFLMWVIKSFDDLVSIISNLSKLKPNEREFLEELVKKGYYNWPRGINIKKLSEEKNLAKATIAKKIRDVEKVVLPNTLRLIKLYENKHV